MKIKDITQLMPPGAWAAPFIQHVSNKQIMIPDDQKNITSQ